MRAARVLARVESLGARIEARGDRLRVVAPRGVLGEDDFAELERSKPELLALLRGRTPRVDFDAFLADASIPLAVMHSRALGREFILARDAHALETLSESDRRLPVLTFADCEKLAVLGPADLAAVLNVREALGPSAELHAVRPRLG